MKNFRFLVCILIFLSGCQSPVPIAPPPITAEIPTITPEPSPTPAIVEEPTATPEPVIVHVDIPGAPLGKMMQTVHDQVDEIASAQK